MRFTVDKFIKLNEIKKETLTSLEGSVEHAIEKADNLNRRLAVFYNKPIERFEAMNFKKLEQYGKWMAICENRLPKKVKKVLWLNGTRYVLQDNVAEHSTEVWLSLIHYREKGNVIKNLNLICSWIYKPTFANFNPDKAAIDFLKADIRDVYSAFFLFLRQSKRWKAHIKFSRQQAMEIMKEHLKEAAAHPWQHSTDGIIP